jgi:hypothetical protein
MPATTKPLMTRRQIAAYLRVALTTFPEHPGKIQPAGPL